MVFRMKLRHCRSNFNMLYFELFQMPVQIQIDQSKLKRQFHQLSRTYHPDNFSDANETEQQAILEKYSLINLAYKTLTDRDATLRYILVEKGLMADESQFKLPPDFLMEMMEMNEMLGENEESLSKVEAFHKQLTTDIESTIINYDDANVTKHDLELLKEYYFKKKYLNRILARTK